MGDLVSALVLTLMEIVLGIDNIIFISMLSENIEDKKKAEFTRRLGLAIALGIRIIALIFVSYLAHMTEPVFSITAQGFNHPVSIRDIILFAGGLFLIHKSAAEIHETFTGEEEKEASGKRTVAKVIVQIVLIDLVFSADSILTAIGLVDKVWIMIVAVVISMSLMFFLAGKIAAFISARPSLKMLALAFLIMIGTMLVAEGSGFHINKAYIYFAMAFACVMEFLNSKVKLRPVPKQQKGKTNLATE